MYTEEQYQIYAKYLIQVGNAKSFLDNTEYSNFDKWLQENNLTIDAQNNMDERFARENN